MAIFKKRYLALAALILCFFYYSQMTYLISGVVVPTYWKVRTRDYAAVSGEGYALRLSPSLEVDTQEIISIKQKCLKEIEKYFGVSPQPPLVIVQKTSELNNSLGASYSMATAGAYQRNVIIVGLDEVDKKFAGTMLHELGHYYVDVTARGNYPSWYSEGLAQLMEYMFLEALWFDAIEDKVYYKYSLEELSGDFYSLEDQVSAYRQALALVQAIEEAGDGQANQRLLHDIGRGLEFPEAVEVHTGLSLDDLFRFTFRNRGSEKW